MLVVDRSRATGTLSSTAPDPTSSGSRFCQFCRAPAASDDGTRPALFAPLVRVAPDQPERRLHHDVTQRFGNPTIEKQRKSKQFKSARAVKTLPRTGVLLPTFLTSARGAQPNRGSVSFVGYPLPRMTGHDLVCSLHWYASPWISRSAGSITTRTAVRRTSSTRVHRRSPWTSSRSSPRSCAPLLGQPPLLARAPRLGRAQRRRWPSGR